MSPAARACLEEITILIRGIIQDRRSLDLPVRRPAARDATLLEGIRFARNTGQELPTGLIHFQHLSNGLNHGGLILWPVAPQRTDPHQETLLEANERLRAQYSNEFIYLGQVEDDLLAVETALGQGVCMPWHGHIPKTGLT